MLDIMKLLTEDSPLRPASAGSKQGWFFLASVSVGLTICIPVFMMGAQLAHQLSYTQFILGALLGGIFTALIATSTGMVGQRTGLPTAMLTKIAFGSYGYIIANAAMMICAIGWFGIQTSVFAESFVSMASQVWDVNLNTTLVMFVSGLLMSTTAVIGFRGLGKLSYVAVPLLLALLMIPLYAFFENGKLQTIADLPRSATPIGFGTMVATVVGVYSFATSMPDVSRFLKNMSSLIIGIIINFVVAYPLILILTGSVALAAGDNDFMQVMLYLGFGSMSLLVLFLSTWTTNDLNVYSGAVSINLFLPQLPRWQIALSVGVLGTLFAIGGIFDDFMSWLVFSGNLFSPLAGVYVADYWLNPDRYANHDNIPKFRVPQLASWLGGLAVGLATTPPDSMGFGVMTLTTIPTLDAILAAAIIQLILHRLHKMHTASKS